MVELTYVHWIYLIFILLIILFMGMRKDISFLCILGIFIIGFVSTKSFYNSLMAVFNGLGYAIKELGSTILIISVITSMSSVLQKSGINQIMVAPFTKFIKTPLLAYWVVGIIMMVVSWFFWPSPAVALVGAILIVPAIKAGLPIIGVAMAMNLFGHGIALSSDFVIQAAPKLTADGAGIPVESVISASIPLVIVMGLVTTIIAFLMLKSDMKKGRIKLSNYNDYVYEVEESILSDRVKKILTVLIYISFLVDLIIMFKFKLKGSDATALIGGTATIIFIFICLLSEKKKKLEKITEYFVEGLQFGFKVFGPVIPIAAFFYMGDVGIVEIIGKILPSNSNGLVNDLGFALANVVPLNSVIGAITLTIVGAITGLDGSGFSGISLAGSTAKLFATATGANVATLTALGQVSAIWVGGGTLVPWALIPVAAICNVDSFELSRRNLIPVVVGMTITMIVSVFLM